MEPRRRQCKAAAPPGTFSRPLQTGNLASSDDGAGTVLGFGYNQADRLVQVASNNVPVATYQHNFLGQRVVKTTASGTAVFHYDRAGHLLAESDGNGNVTAEYIWLDDLPVGVVMGGTLYYLHTDPLGTPQRLTDSGQNVVWDMVLMPFGQVAALTPSLVENLRFPGQYADAETGLSYNYFRDYDPSIGRYVESDPIGLAGGVNTYGYALANPLSRSDPLGLSPATSESIDLICKQLGLCNRAPAPAACKVEKGGDEEACGHQYHNVDIPTCRAVSRSRGREAGIRCYASAADRYAACLSGRDIPPLDT